MGKISKSLQIGLFVVIISVLIFSAVGLWTLFRPFTPVFASVTASCNVYDQESKKGYSKSAETVELMYLAMKIARWTPTIVTYAPGRHTIRFKPQGILMLYDSGLVLYWDSLGGHECHSNDLKNLLLLLIKK
jgi:hypothetical protein